MSSAMVTYALLLVVWGLQPSEAFLEYQTLIPNGNRVPHPCVEGQAWLGVGHVSAAGGGIRNPFGRDFSQHGMKWTKELCRADSDGDGRTNGEELGDPDCTWRKGETPTQVDSISHPGVCEPVTSSLCQRMNSWLRCKMGRFQCDAFEDKDLQNMTLRLPPTPVPPEVTVYTCMLFRLPDDVSFHLVATQPLLNNTQVVHHLLLFGCRDDGSLKDFNDPYRCEMVPHAKCQEVIVTWTIGIQGDCLHRDAGFRLGKGGYTVVALQVHWNNPERSGQFTDSSGLVIHFTPNLRPHDAGILVFGHLYLQIDPLTKDNSTSLQTFTSTCPQHCLREMFNSTIYITTAINHMHYLGKTQLVELVRNGHKVRDLAWDPGFDYDSPVAHRLEPPMALHPGDEIRTTCTFRRPKAGNPVCYGEATSDEMCFGFLTYFPLQRSLFQPWCTSRRSMISCERTLPALWDRPIDDCPWRRFSRPPSQEAIRMVTNVLTTCYTPQRQLSCSDGCRAVLQTIRQHPCFIGDVGYYIVAKIRQYSEHGDAFARAWFTCNCDRDYDACEMRAKGKVGALGAGKDALCQGHVAGGGQGVGHGQGRWVMVACLAGLASARRFFSML